VEVVDGLEHYLEVAVLGQFDEALDELHVHLTEYLDVDCHDLIGDLDTEPDKTDTVILKG
jgi:hypothetical protein